MQVMAMVPRTVSKALRRLGRRQRIFVSVAALSAVVLFLLWLGGISLRMAVHAVSSAAEPAVAVLSMAAPGSQGGGDPAPASSYDLCREIGTEEELKRRIALPFNGVKRPIIDTDSHVFMCVTPKAGISKMEHIFIEFFKRKYPAFPDEPNRVEPHNPAYFRSVAKNRINFSETYGSGKHAYLNTSFNHPDFLALNYTKIFVYRNPIDRFISLWFDKFNDSRIVTSWVGQNFHKIEQHFDIDRLLGNLSYWVLHPSTHRDPHIWPQIPYCDVPTSNYHIEVEIDDYSSLVQHLGPLWGVELSEFGELTHHSTKNVRTDQAKDAALRKLWHYRRNFLSVYYADIEFYCSRRGSLLLDIKDEI